MKERVRVVGEEQEQLVNQVKLPQDGLGKHTPHGHVAQARGGRVELLHVGVVMCLRHAYGRSEVGPAPRA